MRKGTVLRLHGFGVFDFIAKNGLLILILLGLTLGIVFGVFFGDGIQMISLYTKNHLSRYLQMRTEHSFFRIMLDSFMAQLFSLLLLFAAGTSMLGAVFVPVTATGKGVLFGAFTAFIYSEYAVKGIAFHAILILPPTVILLIAYLLAARESFQFSVVMAKMTFSGTHTDNLGGYFKNYCGRYCFLIIAILLSAVLDAVLSVLLFGKFGLL